MGTRPGDDERDATERDAVDRAFADLVAGYHLTSDRPDPLTGEQGQTQTSKPPASKPPTSNPPTSKPSTPEPSTRWADEHPLFRYDEPAPAPEPVELEEHYEPPPPEALPKPAWPVLVAWIAMGYAVLVVLAVVVGLHLPRWAGWLGVIGFVGGFGVLVARLPRHRPPDAGDGAVL